MQEEIQNKEDAPEPTKPFQFVVDGVIPLAGLEARYVLSVLQHYDHNKQKTARKLWISYSTLNRLLGKWYGRT